MCYLYLHHLYYLSTAMKTATDVCYRTSGMKNRFSFKELPKTMFALSNCQTCVSQNLLIWLIMLWSDCFLAAYRQYIYLQYWHVNRKLIRSRFSPSCVYMSLWLSLCRIVPLALNITSDLFIFIINAYITCKYLFAKIIIFKNH